MAVVCLGWTEYSWQEGLCTPFERPWENLRPRELTAARLLGLCADDFDADAADDDEDDAHDEEEQKEEAQSVHKQKLSSAVPDDTDAAGQESAAAVAAGSANGGDAGDGGWTVAEGATGAEPSPSVETGNPKTLQRSCSGRPSTDWEQSQDGGDAAAGRHSEVSSPPPHIHDAPSMYVKHTAGKC